MMGQQIQAAAPPPPQQTPGPVITPPPAKQAPFPVPAGNGLQQGPAPASFHTEPSSFHTLVPESFHTLVPESFQTVLPESFDLSRHTGYGPHGSRVASFQAQHPTPGCSSFAVPVSSGTPAQLQGSATFPNHAQASFPQQLQTSSSFPPSTQLDGRSQQQVSASFPAQLADAAQHRRTASMSTIGSFPNVETPNPLPPAMIPRGMGATQRAPNSDGVAAHVSPLASGGLPRSDGFASEKMVFAAAAPAPPRNAGAMPPPRLAKGAGTPSSANSAQRSRHLKPIAEDGFAS